MELALTEQEARDVSLLSKSVISRAVEAGLMHQWQPNDVATAERFNRNAQFGIELTMASHEALSGIVGDGLSVMIESFDKMAEVINEENQS